MNRRHLLGMAPAAFFTSAAWDATRPIGAVAPLVKPPARWTEQDLRAFLEALPAEKMFDLLVLVGAIDSQARASFRPDPKRDAEWVINKGRLMSGHLLAYPFGRSLDYHGIAKWALQRADPTLSGVPKMSTFEVERSLHEQVFVVMWDKLTPAQRQELLTKVDPNSSIKNKAAIASLSGAAALAALSGAVALSGFAFYTTMSIAISMVAAAVGVTLPFAVYASLSTLVGIFSGPVGWAVLAVAGVGGLIFAGSPDVTRTTAFVCQVHALKIEALIAAGVPEKDVFGRSSQPQVRGPK